MGLARALGVKAAGIVSLWLTGRGRPNVFHALALEALLGLPAASWLTQEEQQAMALVAAEAARLPRAGEEPRAAAVDHRQLVIPGTQKHEPRTHEQARATP